MEAERIEEESIRVNQANIAMQIDEAQKLKEKQARQTKLKEILDQGKVYLLYFWWNARKWEGRGVLVVESIG